MDPDEAVPTRHCWCGNAMLVDFSETYAACSECGTLVSRSGLRPAEAEVHDDEHDFYGKPYWLTHQRDELGFPDIYQRTHLDLPERCLYWLRTLLGHQLPPARVLEVGSGHGAFVALMRAAGFDATGLELSPWVVEFARATFQVPMLQGPVERQGLAERSLDVVVLNDVLEHLAEPRATMRHCATLLGMDGFVMAQTPCYPEGQSHAELIEAHHPFLAMLQEREHLYLFSQRAARRLFAEAGLPTVRFEPALFPYDMVAIASRHPLTPADPKDRQERLLASPGTRLVKAMIDLRDRVDEMDGDRRERIAMIERLNRHIEQTSRDHEARQQVVLEQQATLERTETDRQERIVMIERLNRHIEETSRDYEERGRVILEQQATMEGLRADIARLTAESQAGRQVFDTQAAAMEALTQQSAQLAAAGDAQLRLIADQQAAIEKLIQQREALAELEARLRVVERNNAR